MKKFYSVTKKAYFKLAAAAVSAAFAMLVSVSAFAANTVTVTLASTDSSVVLSDTASSAPEISKSALITVNTNISLPEAEVTIICVDSSATLSSAINKDVLKYIDEDTSDTSGAASFTFRLPTNTAAGTYAVYVGGTEVDTVAAKYFKIADTSGETYLSGDVDKSGAVDGTDAIWILRNEIGLSIPTGCDIDAGDVDHNSFVDGTDAIWILRNEIGLSVPSTTTIGQYLTK